MLLGKLWRSSREGVHWGFVETVLEMLAQLAVDGRLQACEVNAEWHIHT